MIFSPTFLFLHWHPGKDVLKALEKSVELAAKSERIYHIFSAVCCCDFYQYQVFLHKHQWKDVEIQSFTHIHRCERNKQITIYIQKQL